MRAIAIAGAVLAAGCQETAMLLDVQVGDTGATTVELMLVADPCPDCSAGIGPPGQRLTEIPGTVYYLDNDQRIARAPDAAGDAYFRIEPGVRDEVTRLIAIGFDADSAPIALEEIHEPFFVSDHLGVEWKLALAKHAFVPPQSLQAPAVDVEPGDTIALWRAPGADDEASCLAVRKADARTFEFVVPPNDADCDGYIANECKRTWYMHGEAVDTSQPCLTNEQGGGACRLGFKGACVDGDGKQGCAGTNVCVPDAACDAAFACNGIYDRACLEDILDHGNSLVLPRLSCTMTYANLQICPQEAQITNGAFPGCVGVGLVDADAPLPPMGQMAVAVTFLNEDLVVHVTTPAAPSCAFGLGVEGSFLGGMPTGTLHTVGLLVAGKHADQMLVPIVISFVATNDCSTGTAMPTCAFAPPPPVSSDHVWQCGK